MGKVLKSVLEGFLICFVDFLISLKGNQNERKKSERALRKYCTDYDKDLEIEEN